MTTSTEKWREKWGDRGGGICPAPPPPTPLLSFVYTVALDLLHVGDLGPYVLSKGWVGFTYNNMHIELCFNWISSPTEHIIIHTWDTMLVPRFYSQSCPNRSNTDGKPGDTKLLVRTSHINMSTFLKRYQAWLYRVVNSSIDLHPNSLNAVILSSKWNNFTSIKLMHPFKTYLFWWCL